MIALSVTGNTGSYSVLWNTSAITDTIVNLPVGNYMVTVTDNISGCIYTHTFNISNSGYFTITDVINHASCSGCNDGSINITINGSGTTYTYLWSNGATTQDISGVVPGTYTVTVTDSWGCSLVETYIVDFASGISTISDSDKIEVYPNPAKDVFFVKYSFEFPDNRPLEVYDATGRKIKSIICKENKGILQIDLQNSPPGIYFVRMVNGNKVYSSKVALY